MLRVLRQNDSGLRPMVQVIRTDEARVKHRAVSRAFYARNKEQILLKRKKERESGGRVRDPAVYRRYAMKRFGHIYRWLFEYKAQHPCACGEGDHRCLDFDHRDPETKLFGISLIRVLGITDLQVVQEEVAKCDVLCSNCHRKKTSVQFGWHSQYDGEV